MRKPLFLKRFVIQKVCYVLFVPWGREGTNIWLWWWQWQGGCGFIVVVVIGGGGGDGDGGGGNDYGNDDDDGRGGGQIFWTHWGDKHFLRNSSIKIVSFENFQKTQKRAILYDKIRIIKSSNVF